MPGGFYGRSDCGGGLEYETQTIPLVFLQPEVVQRFWTPSSPAIISIGSII